MGDRDDGGDISGVKRDLEQGIEEVWSTRNAFVAQLKNGKVVAWGDRDHGGDISGVKGDLEQEEQQLKKLQVALQALEAAGVEVGKENLQEEIRKLKGTTHEKIEKVWSTHNAFVAQLKNGKVVAWGDRDAGGDISGVKGDLEQGIEHDL